MSIVTLVSGGLDSTLVAKLAQEQGLQIFPLFVDYGQRARDRELAACKLAMQKLGLPEPEIAGLSGFGRLIRSGLTDPTLHIIDDAFTPGRNMLFLLTAAAYAHQKTPMRSPSDCFTKAPAFFLIRPPDSSRRLSA